MRWDPKPPAPPPYEIGAQPWPELAEFYRRLVEEHGRDDLRPMHRLIERIAASRYASGLHGATSMTDLLIAQTERFPAGREVLRIATAGTRIVFTFEEAAAATPWHREYPGNEGFAALEHFLVDLKRWFAPDASLHR